MATGGWDGYIPREGGGGGASVHGGGRESMGGRQTGVRNVWQGGLAQGRKLKGATDGHQRADSQGDGGRNSEGTWSKSGTTQLERSDPKPEDIHMRPGRNRRT